MIVSPHLMTFSKKHTGFTLIELIVVISLMSTMLFLIIPRFYTNLISDQSKKASMWIMVTVQGVKQQAVRDRKDYILHVSIDSGKLWFTNSSMDDDELTAAEQNAFSLPRGLKMIGVDFPNNRRVSFGTADISIYKEGYSDKVFIHMVDDDNQPYSFLIEPFLTSVRRYEEYVTFDD